ncbi:MAG: hypothetical protein KBT32_12080 [Bacteroidales bacterium]|nr:hypothetical protein [Candidatus Physcocola equi]
MNKITNQIIKTLLVGCLAIVVTLTSCTSKSESVIKDLNNIVERVEKKDLSKEELETVFNDYEAVMKEYEKCADQMNEEQRKEWGRLQARYLKAIATEGIKGIGDQLKGVIDVFSGFIEGMSSKNTDENGNTKFDNMLQDFSKSLENIDTTKINQMMQGLSTMGQKIVEGAAKEFETGEGINKLKESLDSDDMKKLMENLNANQLKELANSISEEDLKRIVGSVSENDIKKLKESITTDDIKKIKESFSKEEIDKMKKMLEEATK